LGADQLLLGERVKPYTEMPLWVPASLGDLNIQSAGRSALACATAAWAALRPTAQLTA
jgi:hypothetical protein